MAGDVPIYMGGCHYERSHMYISKDLKKIKTIYLVTESLIILASVTSGLDGYVATTHYQDIVM